MIPSISSCMPDTVYIMEKIIMYFSFLLLHFFVFVEFNFHGLQPGCWMSSLMHRGASTEGDQFGCLLICPKPVAISQLLGLYRVKRENKIYGSLEGLTDIRVRSAGFI